MDVSKTIKSSTAGKIISYRGTTIPFGYLNCDGQAVSRTSYARLFSIIGITYGAGNGSTTFNLPNLTRKTIIGEDVSNSLATIGGSEAVTLSTAELPNHTHIQNPHTHNTYARSQTSNSGLNVTYDRYLAGSGSSRSYSTSTTTATSQSEGGGAAHNNMMPTIYNYLLIKF